jgi:type I restriction-modification system DNA methylase subunit
MISILKGHFDMAAARKILKKEVIAEKQKDIFESLIIAVESCSRDFENLSREMSPSEKTSDFLAYCNLKLADEDKLVKPKLVQAFMAGVLGFKSSDFMPEISNRNGKRPDLTPANKSAHPFAFEIKGMDSDEGDLHDEWVDKGSSYLEDDPDLRFLVITNMREFRVYGAQSGETDRFSLLNSLCFDLPAIYKWAKKDQEKKSNKPQNIAAFESFCTLFSCKDGSLSNEQKLDDIFQAPPDRSRKMSEKERDAEKKNIREDLFKIIENFVNDLKANQKNALNEFYKQDSDSKARLQREIGEISCALDGKVANFVDHDELLRVGSDKLKEYFSEGRIFSDEMDLFFRRVAYFTVFKLLLIRAWEDAEFISKDDWTLYDGGFQRWYNNSNKDIKRVLETAYGIAKNRYEWLFKDNNNYSWYYPSNDSAIDSLWRLSKHNFSVLNNDVLGSIYEEHLNLSAKKKVGLFYTHPKVVSLMWDLAGFDKESNIFETSAKGKKAETTMKRIFDPCMGSGSFLCESIRRVLDVSGIYDGKHGDLKALRVLKDQILESLRGVELDQFAFFIAEINFLLMLTPLVKLIEDKGRGGNAKETFATGLIPHDSLHFYRNDEPGWRLVKAPESAQKKNAYEGTGDALISGRKKDIAKELYLGMTAGEEFGFDFCTSNPPYVGEKTAKDLFNSVKKSNPNLTDIYQGKMDYLYWFVLLGLSKLKPGGKLCYITTAYWPTADGADKLRKTMVS